MKTHIPLVLITFALVCFCLFSKAHAVTPAPDGGYPGNNTAEGTDALLHLTTGSDNTAVGFQALFSNTTGGSNTATGVATLNFNTFGSGNTATGGGALNFNTSGNFNTATGAHALFLNGGGNGNTATGVAALSLNGVGNYNTANGYYALQTNYTGSYNTANGFYALSLNNGNYNTADGVKALQANTTGIDNTATGFSALQNNNGNYNTANGVNALQNNTTGAYNIALGLNAGQNLTTGSYNIDIANAGVAGEAATIRIGRVQTATFIAGISGATVTGTAVVVNGSGQLGVAPSSARFKEAIKSMDNASEALFSLKPVTFRYKKDIDPKSGAQFGLVAEDVEKVNADLVVRDAEGKVYTVRYDAVNAMLLNEFLKEHHTVQEQGALIAHQQKQIDALTTGLQKVSAQLELNNASPQTVLNNQ